MHFIEGHGILGRIRFVDGTMPAYDRTYLVVAVSDEYIQVLNVSSVKGKERKLAFPTNKRLIKYNPPFRVPSFIKWDSLTNVPKCEWADLHILDNGQTLDADELNRIKQMI